MFREALMSTKSNNDSIGPEAFAGVCARHGLLKLADIPALKAGPLKALSYSDFSRYDGAIIWWYYNMMVLWCNWCSYDASTHIFSTHPLHYPMVDHPHITHRPTTPQEEYFDDDLEDSGSDGSDSYRFIQCTII